MNQSGLKNEQLISELMVSGSTAIKTKNDFGVHIFSGSVYNDGVVSSKLVKPKYNNDEILKSIDTSIVELIPVAPPELEDTVLRSVYNVVTQSVLDLTNEVRTLNDVVLSLESKVTELEIVTQSLRVELDGKDLVVSSLQNQNQQSNARVQSTIIDLQNAIQRATSEAIQRVSLTARNESLLQQVESLRVELQETRDRLDKAVKDFIRESTIGDELQRGAFGGDDITANPNITDASLPAITWRGRPRNNYADGRFINGSIITIFNPNDERVTVNFNSTIDIFSPLQGITIEPKKSFNLQLRIDKNKVDKFLIPRIGTKDIAKLGDLQFRTTKSSFSIPVELQIQRGAQYKRPS